jgi:hypothetical protein
LHCCSAVIARRAGVPRLYLQLNCWFFCSLIRLFVEPPYARRTCRVAPRWLHWLRRRRPWIWHGQRCLGRRARGYVTRVTRAQSFRKMGVPATARVVRRTLLTAGIDGVKLVDPIIHVRKFHGKGGRPTPILSTAHKLSMPNKSCMPRQNEGGECGLINLRVCLCLSRLRFS